MNKTYKTSFFHASLPHQNEVENERHNYLKIIDERWKEFKNHYITFYSQVGKAGTIGRQARGLSPQKTAGNVIAFFGRGSDFAIMAASFNNFTFDFKQLKQTWNFLADAIKPARPVTSVQQNFKTSVQYVSDDISTAVAEYTKAHLGAAESTATKMAKAEFVGPLRPEMGQLTAAFIDKEISQQTFETKAAETLLNYNGIAYSQEDQDYAISQETLNSFRSASTHKTTLGAAPVLVFNRVTEVHTPALDEKKQAMSLSPQPAYIS